MRSPKMIIGMVCLFVFSFMFFLYLSFPYGVLKEAIATQVQLATGITMRMESFGPTIPLGVGADGVEIYKGQSTKFKVKSMTAKLSLLDLFLLRLGVSINVEDLKGGELLMGLGFGFLDVLTGNLAMPSHVSLNAKKFNVDTLSAFAIQTAVDNGVGGALAGPLLAKLGFRGNLTGTVDLSLNAKTPSLSTGEVKIGLTDSVLVLSDPSLNIPDQAFKMAQVSAKVSNSAIVIDPSTRLTSTDLDVGLDGRVTLKPQMMNSDLSLKAFLKLQGVLGEQFGIIVDGISNGLSKNGSLNLQITGTLSSPQSNPI